MKKILLVLAIFTVPFGMAQAQRYAFVDTDYILNNIPKYNASQEQLNDLSEEWQQEVEAEYAEIEKMYQEYQAERVLLSDDMRQTREEAIVTKEREVRELQNEYFGQEGMLSQKRQELVQPIQDEVYDAIEDIATEEGYAVIFDSASGPVMIYFNPRYDLSDEVLERLGYKN